MLKKVGKWCIIASKVRWNLMNQNVLISTALISSLWEKQHKDTLDLMMPFLTYAIAKQTSVGKKLNIESITELFKNEFGYENIPQNVILSMLNRLSPNTLTKKQGHYTLCVSLDSELADFEKRRTLFKERRNEVGEKLATYLNENIANLQTPYSCDTALAALIGFFVGNGLVVAQSPSQLSLIRKDSDGKIDYNIARFIVEENKQESVIFDYITDMVKGFFVSTAISFQPENLSLPHSKFKNLHCYLDTRIIIDALGLRLRSAQTAAIEMLTMLRNEQAVLCCFEHTVQEIRDIIKAYRSSLSNPYGKNVHNTLERWDEENYSVDRVSQYLSLLEKKIEALHIDIIPSPAKMQTRVKGLKVGKFKDQLKTNVQYRSDPAYENDVLSVMGVMRLRKGLVSPELEKCGHIFITTNIPMISVVNACLIDGSDFVPPVILDTTMSSVVWFKCSSSHKDYPKHKLIENAMLALEPSHSLLKEFFTAIDRLVADGGISEEEAAIIRSDIQIKRELTVVVNGDPTLINENVVSQLKDKLRDQYIGENKLESEANYQRYLQQKQQNQKALNKIISEIENAGDSKKIETTKKLSIVAYCILAILFLALVGFSIATFVVDQNYWIGAVVLLLVEIAGSYDLLIGKRHIVQKIIRTIANQQAEIAREKKRQEYAPIIESLTTPIP